MPSKNHLLPLFLLLVLSSAQVDLQGFEVLSIDSQTVQNTIEIAVTSRVALKFDSNLSTGYNWYLMNAELFRGSPVLETLNLDEHFGGEYQPKPNPDRLVGMGGNTYFKFKGLGKGKASLQFAYKRLWETEPIKVITVDFDVIVVGGAL